VKRFLLDVVTSFSVLLVIACILLLVRFVFSECQREKERQPTKQSIVLKDETEKPELLVFTAPWCPACKAAEPEIEKLEADYKVVRIDIDADPDSARKYNIESVPTFIVRPNMSDELRTHDVEDVLAALKHEAQARNTAR
jgi:thiol-disulfide isomerase/thioredoxin